MSWLSLTALHGQSSYDVAIVAGTPPDRKRTGLTARRSCETSDGHRFRPYDELAAIPEGIWAMRALAFTMARSSCS